MAATRADVARAAGVSPSTVTYVLTGQRSTRSSTRERVMRAVRELDYQPNITARSLASPGARTLGVLFPPQGARPDGLAVDSEGNVWCAMNRVGKVRLYSPEAEILGEWELPVHGVTAVTLGGPDLRDVFITTSRETADEPHAGAVFHMRTAVPGQPTRTFAG